MLGPATAAIRAYVEAKFNALPMRWPNEKWPTGADPTEVPAPYIEVEIIGGSNALRAFSQPGSRLFIHPGLVRFYIFAPRGTGMTDAIATADQIGAFMERVEFGQADGQTVRTLDFSTYDNVASTPDGNYAVLMASVGFEFFYNG